MEPNNKQQLQLIKMTTTPIPRLIAGLAVPTIISMLITSIYNMADTFFVSQLGTSATGAVGIVFSLMAIIQAIGFTLGMGAGSNMSRLLGQGETKKADEMTSTGFFSAILIGIIFAILGLCFTPQLMRLLGSTETILPYAVDYARFILAGAPIMCASLVMNNNFRSQGKAMLGMAGIGTGGILNILLDPLLILHFELGITGAALATFISQCVSFCILLFFFLTKRSISSIRLSGLSKQPLVYWNIIKTGFPSFCRQGLASIATALLNIQAAVFGDAAIAAMSINSRIFMLILSVMIGFGQGYQPVAGFNFGAKKYNRVKQGFWFEIIVGTIVMTLLGIIGFFFSGEIIALFRDDAQVIAIGTKAMRLQCLVFFMAPTTVISNMMFQAVGKSLQATIASASRQGICFIPLILTLPALFGINGIIYAQPAADVLSFLICIPMLIHFFKYLNQLDS